MKKALVVVSFGTSYKDVLEQNIVPIEEAIKGAFPTYDFYRAFTSRFIVKKLRRDGLSVSLEKELVERLIQEGYERIVVQPTHMIPGFEYEEKIVALTTLSDVVSVGKPLLFGEEDYRKLGAVLNSTYGLDQLSEPFVFMGHGTEHSANQHYVNFGHYLKSQFPHVYLAGVEGDCAFENVLEELKKNKSSKVSLAPLMIVAGDHAKNDMAGEDEDSWKSIAEAAGFDVQVHMKGLGALSAIHQLMIEKMKQI